MPSRHENDDEELLSALTGTGPSATAAGTAADLRQSSYYDPDAEHDDGFGGGGGSRHSSSYRDDPDGDAEFGVSPRRNNGAAAASGGGGKTKGGRSSSCLTFFWATVLVLVGALAGMTLDRYLHPPDNIGGGAGGGGVVIPPHGAEAPPGGSNAAQHEAADGGGGHADVGGDGSEGDDNSEEEEGGGAKVADGDDVSSEGKQQQQQQQQQENNDDDDDEDVADDDAPSYDEEEDDLSTATLGRNKSLASPLPPLSSLVQGTQITRDVSWLLDFAVVDFPKCGTTFLMNYLSKVDETYLNHGEVCSMDRHRPYKIVNRYYPIHKSKRFTDDGRKIKYGLKCPEELETEFALGDYIRYFPKIKFVITVRHPVLWFQSYFNFRAYNSYPLKMPPTDQLIGPCMEGYPYVPWNCSHHCPSGNMKVCTHRAKFHHALSRLGKTPMDTPEEMALLENHGMSTVPTPHNKVFLMENRQIVMENPASATFPRDLRDFLELETDLAPLKHFEKKPGRYSDEIKLKERINICDDEHQRAREVLVGHGRDAATWITEYFLKSPDVVVSSRERFVELLRDWGTDPCDDKERFMLR